MPMKIDWTQVDKAIRYAAMDRNGTIRGFGEIPRIECGVEWVAAGCFASLIGHQEFPTSALLEPYHPKDWEDSRTTRPKEWDYVEMAKREKKQFGLFDDRFYGHLDKYIQGEEYPFLCKETGFYYTTFTPMTEPRPLEEEE